MKFESLSEYFKKGTNSQYPFKPFWKYLNLILKWNQKINLTSLNESERIIEEHFIDSLQLVPYLGDSSTLLDFGSGAGFPGIPLRIVRPEIKLTLVESIKKKVDFIKAVVRELQLDNVVIKQMRMTQESELGQFDTIVSRGTFSIKELVTLISNSISPETTVLLLKGINIDEEIGEAKEFFGPNLHIKTFPYQLPYSGRNRQIVLIRKSV